MGAYQKEVDFDIKSALFESKPMVELAKLIKKTNGDAFCKLPFDHVLEGESLGADILFDEKRLELRRGKSIYHSPQEIINLPMIDGEKGRMLQVLTAGEVLTQEGEAIVLNISGPLTILNCLMEAEVLFRALRKNRTSMEQILDRIQEEILRYVKAATKHHICMFSYADPMSGIDILGPKLAQEICETHTVVLLKRILKTFGNGELLLLCPKITGLLKELWLAEEKTVPLPEPMNYQKACLYQVEKSRLIGMNCINNNRNIVENIKELVLTGED